MAQRNWVAEIVDARRGGASLRDIAEAAGVSHVRIVQILREQTRAAQVGDGSRAGRQD
jgi:transposase-like protein